MSELKPCPFCGEPADGRYQRLAKCCNDKCLMNDWVEDDTLFYLDEAWNNRPIEDALQARIAELEAENIRLGIEYQRMRLALGDIAINSKRALKESPTDHLTAQWRQERQDDKSPNDTQTDTFVYGKERER